MNSSIHNTFENMPWIFYKLDLKRKWIYRGWHMWFYQQLEGEMFKQIQRKSVFTDGCL